MRNRSKSSGVVEDIWINTRATHDDGGHADRPVDRAVDRPVGRPAEAEETTGWDDLEQDNALLNPDPAIPDRG